MAKYLSPVAYWNASTISWEIYISQPAGDRYESVIKSLNVAHQILKEQGYKFVDAKLGTMDMPILLITDLDFYSRNKQDIHDWCKDSNVDCKKTGSAILEFGSKEEKMMFMLRWS